jgi:signal transduction histidine kinase
VRDTGWSVVAQPEPRPADAGRPGRHQLSLRWRLLLLGSAGLIGGLALGGWLLLAALQLAFENSVDAGAAATAADVSALIATDQLPRPVPVAGAQLVQVVDRQDRVRAGSPGADRLVPLLDPGELATALAGTKLEVDGGRAGLDGTLRVLAVPAGPASDRMAVVVAAPLTDIEKALFSLRIGLLVVFVPLVTGLATVAWWMIGRTLRPVEALRVGAEEITGRPDSDSGGRLPVPNGADEIHRLAVTLNRMLDRLDVNRRQQRQFVADAAHELRNPLAGMRTLLEVADRHPDRVDWSELTSDLLADTERLTGLTNDLLLLASIDERGGPVDMTDLAARRRPATPLGPILEQVGSRYRNARVPVRVAPSAALDGLSARVVPDDLHRVLANLVDNAVRHSRTEVRVSAEEQDGQVRITVTDDGPGIPAGDRDRVFGRFTRLDDARAADDGGAGLGLAIVAELVRRHGGTVRLADAEPGLRAEVRLPGPGTPP